MATQVFTGILTGDNDVAQQIITLSAPSPVSIQTYQYGGSLTIPVPSGGIDSVIALFAGTGPAALLLAFNDDGDCPPANDANGCFDSTLTFPLLAAGDYLLTVSAATNLPMGPTLGAGFTGGGSITSSGNFYALITTGNDTPAPGVPEPATLAISVAGLGAMALHFTRRRASLAIVLCSLSAASITQAADFALPSGGDLQGALNAAQPGDTITLAAGGVYTGNYVAPAKSGNGWITIRTSSAALLAREGVRVSPADSPQMAAIVTPVDLPGISFLNGAHHYRVIGIEIRPVPGLYNPDLIRVGLLETSVAQLPHDIEIDRCYLHGDPTVGGKRGIMLNGAQTLVQNSYLSGFTSPSQETQALGGWRGTGPYQIVNNYLEASGVNVEFGGAPADLGVIPSDIQVLRNHIRKLLSWKPGDPSFAGTQYLIKNLFELKFARRVLVDGNVLENSWYPEEHGQAFVLGPRAEPGFNNPVIEDVQITRNIIRNVGLGMLIFGRDGLSGNAGSLRNLNIENNLFLDLLGSNSLPGYPSGGSLALVHTGPENVRFAHNTYVGAGQAIFGHSGTLGAGYVVENNLLPHNVQGILHDSGVSDKAALDVAAPLGYVFRGNAVQGGIPANLPTGNFFPATNNDIGYANLALRDVRLLPSSPFRHAATDGKDVGADAAAVNQVTLGVVPGSGAKCITSAVASATTFPRGGGTGTVTITAPAGCQWTTDLGTAWLGLTGGYSGVGSGAVTFTVPVNPVAIARTDALRIGGLKIAIKQNP